MITDPIPAKDEASQRDRIGELASSPAGAGEHANSRRLKLVVLVAASGLLVAAGMTVFYWFDPARSSFFPACLFHRFTGLNCPGCGGQRALHELLHGNFLVALRHNALLIFLLTAGGGLVARYFLLRSRGAPNPVPLRPVWIWIFVGAMIVFGVLRNLPGFVWLSP